MDFAHLPHPAPVPGATRDQAIADPGFGSVFTDHMVTIDYHADKGWHSARIGPREALTIDPACAVLHYAQEIFEGLKAYRHPDGSFALFNGKGGCSQCHTGWNFTEDSFHDIGLPDEDVGRGKFNTVALKMKQAFKTPGLRDIALRGPYMHDGSMPTLAAVIEHYDTGGVDRPSRSDLMKPLGLTSQEKSDLVAFLQTLTGPATVETAPVLPR